MVKTTERTSFLNKKVKQTGSGQIEFEGIEMRDHKKAHSKGFNLHTPT